MTDRLDSRIRALVVEMLDQPPAPPSFPSQVITARRQPVTPSWRRGWAVATAGFLAVLVVGVLTVWVTRPADEPVPVGQVAANLSAAVNAGDLDAVLQLFAEDAECPVPGRPTCEDLFGFLIAANGQMVLGDCALDIEPYWECSGYVHTDVHDAVGITLERLQAFPNLHPRILVEGGVITEFSFNEPFTGIGAWDEQLWTYLLENDAPFVNSFGIPLFSAEIVPDLLEAARQFTEDTGGF